MMHFSRLFGSDTREADAEQTRVNGEQTRGDDDQAKADALLTNSNYTPRMFKSIFTQASPASPASPLSHPSTSKATTEISPPFNRCSPKKLRKSSSLRNMLHHNNDSHGKEGCMPSPRSEVFTSSSSKSMDDTVFERPILEVNDADVKITSPGRKRAGSLKERAKAIVRRMSFSETDFPRPLNDETDTPPMPPIPTDVTTTNPGRPSIESFAALSGTLPYGTPIRGPMYGKRGILREDNVPGSGNSVRFVSRDQYKTITPNTSTVDGSFIDAPESISPPHLPETSHPTTFLAKLHSASMTDTSLQGNFGHAGVTGDAGPSRPSSLTKSQGRNMASSFGAFAPGTSISVVDALNPSTVEPVKTKTLPGRPPIPTQLHGPSSSNGGSTSPSKTVSFSQLDMPSMDMGDLPEDMSNLMDGDPSRVVDLTANATSDVFNTATGNTFLSGSGMSNMFSEAGRTPMPKRWLRADSSPAQSPAHLRSLSVGSPASEKYESRWSPDTSPGDAGEASLNSSCRSVGVMIEHDDASMNRDERSSVNVTPGVSQSRTSSAAPLTSPTPLQAASPQQLSGGSPDSRSMLSYSQSNPTRAVLHRPSSDPEEPVVSSPDTVTPARADATIYLTPMSFIERSLSFGSSSEAGSPGEVSEEASTFARLPQALMRTSNNLMEAQETHVQIVQMERERYRALSEKLQGELELRQDLMEKLKAQVRAVRSSRPGAVGSTSAEETDEEAASVADLCASLERRRREAAAEHQGLVEEKVTLSQKLVATEEELRDALIRVESLQRDVTRQVERENAMEKTCRQLESQVEQMRSDKSVIYHQAREQVIMGYAAETVDEQELRSLREASQKDREELVLLRQELRMQSETHVDTETALRQEIGKLREALESQRSDAERREEHMAALELDGEELAESLRQSSEEKGELEETLRRSASDHKNELAAEVAHLHYQVQTLVEASEASAQVIQDLETNIRGRGEEINHLKQMLAASQQEAETSSRALAEAEDSHARETADLEYQRQILQQQLDLANSGIQAHSQDLRAQRESLRSSVQAAAAAAAEADDIRSRLDLMSCEVDRLQKEIILMRSQSANKEVQITQLQKLRDQLKEDKEMLNIALDSKQQELEIMKRKFSVRGVAGITPTASRYGDVSRRMVEDTPGPTKTLPKTPAVNNRQSAGFITPAMPLKMLHRSAAPKSVAEGKRMISALGESGRHNSMITPSLPVRSMTSEAARRHSLIGSVPTLDRRLTRGRATEESAGRGDLNIQGDVKVGVRREASSHSEMLAE